MAAVLEANRVLEARVQELEHRLSQNSRNSSKRPSSDSGRKPVKSLREKGTRKTGGQPGHEGRTLAKSASPDEVVKHEVERCETCATDLKDVQVTSIDTRQVIDLPKPTLFITEHQAECKTCPSCGEKTQADFPEEVNAPVQYGGGVKAMVSYLHIDQLLPFARACELVSDLYGCSISEGTLAQAITTLSDLVEPSTRDIKAKLEEAQVAHFDETGLSIEGQRKWLHVASTDKLTYYEAHEKRGSQATEAIGILPNFAGRAVHDHWKPYFGYSCKHGLCNAHHLRELIFVAEELGQAWASAMQECLLDIKKAVDQTRDSANCLTTGALAAFEERYQYILSQGYAENPLAGQLLDEKPKRGRRKKTKPRNLLERLDTRREETLAFMYDFSVPFDNNQAERDVRMAKVKQKISGTFRSWQGARAFARIRSYVSTARKHGQSAYQSVRNAFSGQLFYASS